MSNLINEINAENILIDVQELNRLELIAELKMGIYEASYWSFDDLVNLVVELRLEALPDGPLQMNIRQIFLDQDGVLADFESGLTKALGYKVNLKDKKDVYDQEKRKLTAQRLFRNLKPLPDAWKLVDYCMNSGIHTEILTAAGTVNRTLVIKDKIDWIRRYINPYWIIIPTFKGSQKAAFAHKKAVLIDDRQRNIDAWVEAGGIGILHKTADDTIEQLDEIINAE